jgi:membrane protease YdiL (CAAX protease family)
LSVIGYGFLWFLAIRLLVALVMWTQSKWIDPHWLWASEEKMFSVVHARNIVPHPLFSVLVFGIVSLLAGFSEELWRSGMLGGLAGLFPQIKAKGLGTLSSVLFVSAIFGFGHLYQGLIGMENALLLGVFLGLIIVYRRSYWEAAVTHALIDASAFGVIVVLMLHPHLLNAQVVSAASRGDVPRAQYLIEMGADVNAVYNSKGVTALEEAAYRSYPEMVRFLLEKGANPNVKDMDGQTPLILAAEKNQLESIKLLLARGADLNWKNERGFTALRAAVQYNRLESARLLIESGADLNLEDKAGATPLAAAQNLGYSDLVNLLQQKGAR